jgi:quinoprotein glucose dehydrogenase
MSPPGDIRAYDVLTGKLVWTFHTVPRPGEFGYDTWPKDAWKYVGGTNAWGELTIDASRGIAYVPLGSPTYDFYGADRVGANLFGTSVVALDARTGKRLWHFQIVHHDLWDMDPSAAPQLTTIRHNGRNRDVVVVTAKTGWLYVFDRVTGEPIWPIEERPVPKSEMEHEQSWPTQPYPTNPPPYIKHTFGIDDISPYLSAEDAETFKKRLLAADNKGIFTPISLKDTVHVPASNGGTLFGGVASEPRTGAVYVVAHENPGIVRLLRPGEGRGSGVAPVPPGQIVYQQHCQSCHGPNREGVPDVGQSSRDSGSGQQHRGGGAALRRRCHPRDRRERQGTHARVSAPHRGGSRQPRHLPHDCSWRARPRRRCVRGPRARRESRRIGCAAGADCWIRLGVDAT